VRHHRLGTLARWTLQGAPGLVIFVVVLFARPAEEWPAIGAAFLLYLTVVSAFVLWIVRDRRIDYSLRRPGSVAFVTQNLPGAIVHLERFQVPDAGFARGPSFVIVADDTGLGYFTRGKNPVAFVRIPWAEIASVGASGGDLIVTLADGNLLLHVPGGLLPMGARRVRALAGDIAPLLPVG